MKILDDVYVRTFFKVVLFFVLLSSLRLKLFLYDNYDKKASRW